MATTPDYSILGQPRISSAGFRAILQAAASPAAGEAAACYKAFTAAGVDPAVGLAIFRKESTFGRYGYAHDNRSWGNIREPSTGKFRRYPTWTAGAADCARLLVIYGTNRIRPGTKTDTVQTFPYVWAPTADGNAPDAYGDALARWITEWRTKYPPTLWGSDVKAAIRAVDPAGRNVGIAIRRAGHSYGTVINIGDLEAALKLAGHKYGDVVDPSDVSWLLAWSAKQ
jgi:hypothetical protein